VLFVFYSVIVNIANMQFNPLQSCWILFKVRQFMLELSFCYASFYFACLYLYYYTLQLLHHYSVTIQTICWAV